MTDQEILEKAIQKAIDDGWQFDIPTHKWEVYKDRTGSISISHPDGELDFQRVVFNHDFAKSLWSNDKCDWGISGNAEIFIDREWQLHLCRMVIAEDPLAYLKENI